MKNTIPSRIFEFLRLYPPFSFLEQEQLMRVAERVVVQYRPPDEVIFRQGTRPGQYIYMVRQGAVHLVREEEGSEVLVEECDEGDVFGIRPFLIEDNYLLTAKAVEESLIYAVNIEGFEQVLSENPRVAFYLASNFAAGIKRSYQQGLQGKLFFNRDQLIDSQFHLIEIQSLERSKKPVTCFPDASIRKAATIMSKNEVGSIIVVNEHMHPLGIVTDRDLRTKVVTGTVKAKEAIAVIMTSPVVTLSAEVTVADVQIEMVKHGIHHICLTADGTPDSEVVGVISEHDLLVIQGNNPAVLVREVRRTNKVAELRRIRERAEELMKKYIYQEVSIAYISTIMTVINDALIQRVISLSEAEMEAAGYPAVKVGYCWLALGSEGRGEQLLRTDQDSALIFEDVPEADYKDVKDYFLTLAAKVTAKLNQCGFAYCPGDMMASNPKWCQSKAEWKDQFSDWIYNPSSYAILHSFIFFDYRPIYGDFSLSEALTAHIFEAIEKQTIFLAFMAKAAIEKPPPLTFFRNFVVERSGEHKDEFDIKTRAMLPLADAARVLVLGARVGKINNTFRRFEKLAELEPQNAELYTDAAQAYEILVRYRALQGLKNKNSGRFFKPSELSKMERINLRNSFRPIQELQSLLNMRFQLAYLR